MTETAPKHSQIFEFFTLSRRLAEARASSGAPGLAECELGVAGLVDALQLASSPLGRDTALLLYRSAARLLLSAELKRRGLSSQNESWADAWSKAKELDVVVGASVPLLEPVLASEGGEAWLAKLGSVERDQVLRELSALAQRLADGLDSDVSRVRRVLWTRRFRLAALAFSATLLIVWSIHKLATPENLALDRPVVVTDTHPEYRVDPRHVVDGDELNLGFHTSYLPKASVTIDLGSVRPVKRAVVFNRIDCCQERAVPLSLELSHDGEHFTRVGRRKQRFQQWRVAMPAGSHARYVRLVHEAPGMFHLAEIQIF